MKKKLFLSFIRLWKSLISIGIKRIPGANRLYGLMYSKLNPNNIALINIPRYKLYVNTSDRGFIPMLLKDGTLTVEKYKIDVFTQTVKEGMVVIDIGAAIGYYTVISSKLVGKKGVVYAFEPAPSNYDLLCRNININHCTNVTHFKKAVSNKLSKDTLYINNLDMAGHSLSRSTRLESSKNLEEWVSSVEVETITLDDFLCTLTKNIKVDIVKINVEGAEGLVILGAKKMLEHANPKIFMEFWPYALKNLGAAPEELLLQIKNYGYKIKFINERKRALEPIQDIIKFCRTAANLDRAPNLLLEK